jgi:hypothetical protein
LQRSPPTRTPHTGIAVNNSPFTLCAAFALASTVANGAQSVADILQEEMRALNEASNTRTELTVEDEGGISSSPASGIMFSRTVFERIRRESNVKQLRGVIRFLVAHEQAHQIQFEKYGVDKMRSTNAEWNRLKECQADLLAAKYLTLSYDEAGDDPRVQKDINEALRDMLEVSFNLGEEEKGADHPNRQARRTATRLGAARGQLEKLKSLPQSEPLFAESRRHLEVVLDVRPSESLLDWSLRQARRIVHHDTAAYRSLSLEKQQVRISDKSLKAGTAAFDLSYTNRGNRPLRVDMEVQCVTAHSTDPEDTSRWQKWTVRNYEFTVGPGESYTARGQLGWQKIAGTTVPRLIVPVLHDTALVSCSFAD